MKRTLTPSVFVFLLMAVLSAVFPSTSSAQSPGYILMLAPPAPSSITAPSGGVTILSIFIIPLNGFTGTVDFTCTVTGGSAPLPSCPNPVSVNVTGTGAVSSGAIVTTTSTTPTATYTITVTGSVGGKTPPANGPQSMPLPVSHSYSVGSAGGGGIALLTFAALLALWATRRVWRIQRPALP